MDHRPSAPIYQSADELKKEDDRRFWEDAGAATAGMLGGMALGVAAVPPLEVFQRARIERASAERAELFRHHRDILRTLNELHRKRLSWDDIEPAARPQLEQSYQDHKALLNDPVSLANALREKAPADVIRMPGVPKFRFSQLFPSVEVLKKPLLAVQHPIPATLGLMGGFVGGYAMDRYRMKRMYDKLKGMEEGGNHDDVGSTETFR